ncbi:MAG: aspartate kinase [Chloroflexi bacterium]|nr:aspartate kinase [Chloroflexota bacterium]
MPLIVQKYGGSSVATIDKIKSIAQKVCKLHATGVDVVLVVSAMGKTTDGLIELAYSIAARPAAREMDMLCATGELVSASLMAVALQDIGCPAIAFSGVQAGMNTTAEHMRARIDKIDVRRLNAEIKEGKVVVVAGFQGIDQKGDITTLGRGGSDTSAVAIAIALKADECRIFTDVDGIYTADPHIVEEAVCLKEINYPEMLEMATYGAKVMHARAVELGGIYNMPILVANSHKDVPGTLIHKGANMESRNKATGITSTINIAKVTVVGVPDRPGVSAKLFGVLAAKGISVDTIVQNSGLDGTTDLSFTVARNEAEEALEIIRDVAKELGAKDIYVDKSLGEVSLIGSGMQNTPGYASTMFNALAERNININLITTSEIRITCIIDETAVKEAVKVLHKAFELENK